MGAAGGAPPGGRADATSPWRSRWAAASAVRASFPVPFEPATATPTAQGQERVSRLVAWRPPTCRSSPRRGGRLPEMKLVQRDDAGGRVELAVLEPETPRPSKTRELLRRIGVPLAKSTE